MQVGQTNRRAFIAALGGAAAWPRMTHAQQQTDKVWRVGYLSPSSATDFSVSMFNTFRLKLQNLGYFEGKNLRLEVRRAEGDLARLPALATELVSLGPDVILTGGTPATRAVQHATSSIPIVMVAVADPIGEGFIRSFPNPGGNITGNSDLSVDLAAKSLELLHLAFPNAKRIAVLATPVSSIKAKVEEAKIAAVPLGLTIIPVMVPTPADMDGPFATIHNERCDALLVLADTRLITRGLVELSNTTRLPTLSQYIDFVDMGGLMGYGPNISWIFPQAAIYVDRILKGANPADLPVEQPTKFELVINLKTSKLLGLTIPDSIVARADRVIE
jgi:putative ABC transport system substrate-binding protein